MSFNRIHRLKAPHITDEHRKSLYEIISTVLPVNSTDWEEVANRFNSRMQEWVKAVNSSKAVHELYRTGDQLKTHFENQLSKNPTPSLQDISNRIQTRKRNMNTRGQQQPHPFPPSETLAPSHYPQTATTYNAGMHPPLSLQEYHPSSSYNPPPSPSPSLSYTPHSPSLFFNNNIDNYNNTNNENNPQFTSDIYGSNSFHQPSTESVVAGVSQPNATDFSIQYSFDSISGMPQLTIRGPVLVALNDGAQLKSQNVNYNIRSRSFSEYGTKHEKYDHANHMSTNNEDRKSQVVDNLLSQSFAKQVHITNTYQETLKEGTIKQEKQEKQEQHLQPPFFHYNNKLSFPPYQRNHQKQKPGTSNNQY